MADLRKLVVWNGNWVTPASDCTAASSVVKQALDQFAQHDPGLTHFGRIVVIQAIRADATAGHHDGSGIDRSDRVRHPIAASC
jgi:hypothetical protein